MKKKKKSQHYDRHKTKQLLVVAYIYVGRCSGEIGFIQGSPENQYQLDLFCSERYLCSGRRPRNRDGHAREWIRPTEKKKVPKKRPSCAVSGRPYVEVHPENVYFGGSTRKSVVCVGSCSCSRSTSVTRSATSWTEQFLEPRAHLRSTPAHAETLSIHHLKTRAMVEVSVLRATHSMCFRLAPADKSTRFKYICNIYLWYIHGPTILQIYTKYMRHVSCLCTPTYSRRSDQRFLVRYD